MRINIDPIRLSILIEETKKEKGMKSQELFTRSQEARYSVAIKDKNITTKFYVELKEIVGDKINSACIR